MDLPRLLPALLLAAPFQDPAAAPGRARHELELQSAWRELAEPGEHGLLAGTPVELVRPDTLDGWRALGDARWGVEGNAIRGRVGGGAQSFLRTERTFGDFVLELELRLHGPGNSGIQVRSAQTERGRVQGYQIEIDPSPRAWSGGLYDEGRRGWLQDLSERPAAREAFDHGGWNHYRIECLGPWIRSWVNGVPAADHFDPLDLEGFIALQVHSGRDADLTWRNLRLVDLGRRAWIPLLAHELSGSWARTAGDWSAREAALVGTAGPEGARLASPEPWDDFTLRLELRCEGDARPRLHFRRAVGASPTAVDPVPVAPGLLASPAGWILDAADPALAAQADPQGWTSLALAVYGERVVLHAGGRCLADLREVRIPRAGALAFELPGPGGAVHLRRIERLGPPR